VELPQFNTEVPISFQPASYSFKSMNEVDSKRPKKIHRKEVGKRSEKEEGGV
jgi:hypothetical protein